MELIILRMFSLQSFPLHEMVRPLQLFHHVLLRQEYPTLWLSRATLEEKEFFHHTLKYSETSLQWTSKEDEGLSIIVSM